MQDPVPDLGHEGSEPSRNAVENLFRPSLSRRRLPEDDGHLEVTPSTGNQPVLDDNGDIAMGDVELANSPSPEEWSPQPEPDLDHDEPPTSPDISPIIEAKSPKSPKPSEISQSRFKTCCHTCQPDGPQKWDRCPLILWNPDRPFEHVQSKTIHPQCTVACPGWARDQHPRHSDRATTAEDWATVGSRIWKFCAQSNDKRDAIRRECPQYLLPWVTGQVASISDCQSSTGTSADSPAPHAEGSPKIFPGASSNKKAEGSEQEEGCGVRKHDPHVDKPTEPCVETQLVPSRAKRASPSPKSPLQAVDSPAIHRDFSARPLRLSRSPLKLKQPSTAAVTSHGIGSYFSTQAVPPDAQPKVASPPTAPSQGIAAVSKAPSTQSIEPIGETQAKRSYLSAHVRNQSSSGNLSGQRGTSATERKSPFIVFTTRNKGNRASL